MTCVTHPQPFYGPLGFRLELPGWVDTIKYHQEGKPNLDLLEQEIVSGSGISWAICKSASWPRHNHASIPSLIFLQARCPSYRPTNSVKALRAIHFLNLHKLQIRLRLLPDLCLQIQPHPAPVRFRNCESTTALDVIYTCWCCVL